MSLKDWPSSVSEYEPRQIAGFGHIYHPLQFIIDSKEFQRLRNVKQVGFSQFVYPTSVHNRYCHSLGTYRLASKFVERLRRSYPTLEITGADVLCVALAGLCHDMGHGPFSHTYDGYFREAVGGTWNHEELTVKLLRRRMTVPEVRKAFAQYLGESEEYEQNLLFIEELISMKNRVDPTKNEWMARGRPKEKSFLYDIVSNENDGFDVDKFDYLIRDSTNADIGISFDMNEVDRLIDNARVLRDPDTGYLRIAYASKVADSLIKVGQGRQFLHDRLYQHKTVRAIEHMAVRALVLANEELLFVGDDGKCRTLSDSWKDMGSFLKTTDAVLTQIANSTTHSPKMIEARRLVEAIESRQIPRQIAERTYSPSSVDRMLKTVVADGSDSVRLSSSKRVENLVLQEFFDLIGGKRNDVFLLTRVLHRGMGRKDPMEQVLIFDRKKNSKDTVAYHLPSQWLRLKAPNEPEFSALCLYAERSVSESDRQKMASAFDEVLHSLGLHESPSQSPMEMDE